MPLTPDPLTQILEKVQLIDGLVLDVREIKSDMATVKFTLNEHTRILNEHTRILDEHTRILGIHDEKLDALTAMHARTNDRLITLEAANPAI